MTQANEKVAAGATVDDLISYDTERSKAGTGPNDTAGFAPAQPLAPPRARHNSTGGTAEAAAVVAGRTSNSIAAKILAVITTEKRPMSAEEVRAILVDEGVRSPVQTYRARLTDLAQAGLLRDSGQRGVSESGCSTVRWELVPAQESAA